MAMEISIEDIPEDRELDWRMKKGVGAHKYRDPISGATRQLKPGDMVRCTKGELRGALDKFELYTPYEQIQKLLLEGNAPHEGLCVIHRGGKAYDVIRSDTGETVNDKPMTEEAAKRLVNAHNLKGDEDFVDKGKGKEKDDEDKEDERPECFGKEFSVYEDCAGDCPSAKACEDERPECFGKQYDEFEDCTKCEYKEGCRKEQEE
ncbi:hypothetical protein LCGC14_0717560 [marine sediment metagenome]|uniref:Uncharacterized protein n=1 Tax=marine sediment metagenome TaxID=412755 RepID=A0A0F9SYN7_9ZZZZ